MDFQNDPRRSRIEPMHEFLTIWSEWGRHHPVRLESMTWKIMVWIENHAKRDRDIEEGIVTGERIHVVDEDRERIAWKVEYLLTRQNIWEGHQREREVLIGYYKAHPSMHIAKIANRRLGVKTHQAEETVKKALLYFSYWWRAEE